ncbi:MAG: transcription-repair coupling factor, partial [Prevotella sp.]|nr:transcription-repair coupling factor [Prevotella sp.]
PDARVAIGHGQMKPEELEKVVMGFINFDYDVLLSTTIVENGIDIPNANTIIINDAHHFGLSDLHQMRGRVGRSNKKAFCYLLAPPAVHLTTEARKRLEALETFSELGSGFNLSMQDLDIRGAGNLLGAEQSGFMEDLGYETYQKILNQAMAELRNEATPDPSIERGDNEGTEVRGRGGARNASEQPELGANHNVQSSMFNVQSYDFVDDCALESDIEMYFPDQFVPNDSERMLLYRELDNLANRHDLEASLEAYRNRLRDRFGAIPEVAEELIRVVPLRVAGKQLGVEKIMLKQQKMILFFVSNPNSPYYQSEAFGRVIEYATKNVRRCNLREVNGKRSMVVTNISSVDAALSILKTIPLAS